MARQTTWEELSKRSDLVRGTVRSFNGDGIPCMGPLAGIRRSGGLVQLQYRWCASMSPTSQDWECCPIKSSIVSAETPLLDIGDGRVSFSVPFLGHFLIFPKGSGELDPHQVRGLPKELMEATN